MSQYKLSERSTEWPYNYLYANSQVSLYLCQNLSNLLPHGSGINYTWHISRSNNRLFYASNSYESMNEVGMYCHVYQFTAIYKYHGTNSYKPCEYCQSIGKRFIKDFMKYHPNQSPMQIIEWLVTERQTIVNWDIPGNTDSTWFKCNVCDGLGKIPLKPFELIRLNWHGQKEYNCCGYGLRDYLFETLMLD